MLQQLEAKIKQDYFFLRILIIPIKNSRLLTMLCHTISRRLTFLSHTHIISYLIIGVTIWIHFDLCAVHVSVVFIFFHLEDIGIHGQNISVSIRNSIETKLKLWNFYIVFLNYIVLHCFFHFAVCSYMMFLQLLHCYMLFDYSEFQKFKLN